MKRQTFQVDRVTGKIIHFYVDLGPSCARPRVDKVLGQIGGTKSPPAEATKGQG